MKITAMGFHRSDNRPLPLPALLAFTVTGSLASPAVSCRAQFALPEAPTELHSISLTQGNATLFHGEIDQLRHRTDKNGQILTLEARSRGARLLDNEALPGTLWGANLRTVFSRYAAPLHCNLYQGHHDSGRTLPVFSVYKGMSHWDVLQRFVQRLYGNAPYAIANTIYTQLPAWTEAYVLSNQRTTPGVLPFTQLEQVFTPYHMLSDIILRGEDGTYRTRVTNPEAAHYQLTRSRYHIPTREFQDNPVLDANQRIRASLYQSWEWVVSLPQILPVQVGQGVSLYHDSLQKSGLIIDSWTHSLSPEGATTTLFLRNVQWA